MNLWIRQYILQIGNSSASIQITTQRITFSITRNTDKKPNKATIRVYNLNRDHMNMVTSKQYTRVALSVGYGVQENCRVLYSGQITRGYIAREGVDNVLVMECDDGATDYKSAFMSVTLSAGSTHTDVVNQALKTFTDVQPGIYGVPSDVTLPRAKVCYGPTSDVLTQVSYHHGADWSVQNGRLHIMHPDYCAPGEAVLLNQQSGMINGPRVTDNGLEVSSLLRPEFVVNGLVRIDSIFDEYDGDYKIVAIEDDGDTHGDQWGSRLTCVNGKFKAAKKMKEKK